VKTKATNGASKPISTAIAGCQKDRLSRLARTLVWLRERALAEDLGVTTLAHLKRFIEATDYPPSKKEFFAIAVICSSLVDAEVSDAPTALPTDYTVVIISVPELKRIYTSVFDAVRESVATPGAEVGGR
jgi:hypothetical protein